MKEFIIGADYGQKEGDYSVEILSTVVNGKVYILDMKVSK